MKKPDAQPDILSSVIENLSQGLSYFDSELNLVVCNKRYLDLLGFPHWMGTPGTHISAFFRFNAERGEYGPGDVEDLVQERVDLARNATAHSFERERPDGTVLRIQGTPLPDGGFVTTYGDITELRKSQHALEETNQRLDDLVWERTERLTNREAELVEKTSALETILETINYGISLFDQDLKLVALNRQCLELMGLPDEFNQVGRHFSEFIRYLAERGEYGPGDTEDIVKQRVAKAASGDPFHVVRELPNGRIIEIIRRPIEAGFVSTYRDVTEEKRQEALLKSTNEELERRVEERTAELNTQLFETERAEAEMREAKSRAEHADKAKSDFLARMSHEIRTPLNGIIGLSRILSETRLDDNQSDIIRKVLSSSDALLNIVNDILDFAKIEAGRIDIEEIPFTVGEILESVTSIASPKAEEQGLTFEIDGAAEISETFIGDPHRIGQILTNFCSNAVKFTESGGIRIKVSASSEASGLKELTFGVEDSGIGLTEEEASRIFSPFDQADASTTRRYGGTGLGLAICRELAELMNGRTWVESTPGTGSTFYLSLPLQIGGEDCEAAIPDRDWKALCDGLRVLLVEDNQINREIAGFMLEGAGMDVSTAEHGLEAVELMATHPEPGFDAILMDIQMPEMDGHEACHRILADPVYANMPIIALTAHAVAEEIEKCRAVGMRGHVSKPIDPAALFRTIATSCGR